MLTLANFIGGRNVPPAGGSGAYLDVTEPATGQVFARVPDSGPADIDAAVKSAASAFPAWSATSANERSRILFKLADLIDANLDRLAEAECRDTGKPISLARAIDIPRSAANFRYFATAILHTTGEMHEFDGGGVPAAQGGVRALNYTLRRPRGVAGLISPWNLPLYLLTWKIAPALATGNTAVCKPSEVTPLTASLLGDLANEAGLPPGVLNIVHGLGPTAGGALVTHPDVPTISFTGSTAVGKWIAREAGDRLKRVSLELGGKNPFVVFDDADFDAALSTAVRAGFSNQGQICLCGSRLIVQEGIYRRFVDAFVDRVKALKIGDPMDPATQFGALTSQAHLEKVEGYVKLARELGGKVLCGGQRVSGQHGFFYPPTIIEGLDPACRVEQEEIFGPVVTIQPFTTDDDAIRLANSTPYGLASTVFTQSLGRANRFSAEVQSGIVWVNCWLVRDLRTPFGGVKQSGVGREGGLEAIKFFTEPRNVCVRV
ncbi:MAG TPA: aldehyde dehydrogenase [Phycisphaerales bacterium]|nr:aldehyde dehydrogenase [Phycisphaerales bacterium]